MAQLGRVAPAGLNWDQEPWLEVVLEIVKRQAEPKAGFAAGGRLEAQLTER